ncbi:MAG: hypothetical protein SNJ54_00565 [Anaerolineae bacterium]
MPSLKAIVYEYWLAAQRVPARALALEIDASRCKLLQTYREALTAEDNLPLCANLLIVFQDNLPLVLDAQLINVVRQRRDRMIVVVVNQASAQFYAAGWYISDIDLEAVDLSSDLSVLTHASSGEAYAVVAAAVVALALLVIIAVSLLPAAPALT